MGDPAPARVVPKPLPVLKGLKIHFAQDHLFPPALDVLTGYVTSHAGTIVDDRQHATHLIVHPGCVKYKDDQNQRILLAAQYPGLTQPKMVPYHWLCQVHLSNTLVDIETLSPPLPIFFHPAISEHNKPLVAWVSVNVQRHTDESDAAVAQQNVDTALQMGGALGSTKRSRADLLIVDRSTNFAQKVKAERKEHRRFHQKLAERDWVDDCVRNRKLSWHTAEDEMKEDNEAMIRDMNQRAVGKGPGRPTGLPRNEYTDADDEFLSRYLAYYHPTGSWSSRKTYEDMLASHHPEAQSHSMESWLNRFKKNQTRLEKRIYRAQRDGLDGDLKTASERKNTESRREAQEAKKEVVKAEAATPSKKVQAAEAGAAGTPSKSGKAKETGSEGGGGGLSEKHVDTYRPGPKSKPKQLVEPSESSIESAKSQTAATRPAGANGLTTQGVVPGAAEAGPSSESKFSGAGPVANTESLARDGGSTAAKEQNIIVEQAGAAKQQEELPALHTVDKDGQAAVTSAAEGRKAEITTSTVPAESEVNIGTTRRSPTRAEPTTARNASPAKSSAPAQSPIEQTSESSVSRSVPTVAPISSRADTVALPEGQAAVAPAAADESETQALLSDFRRPPPPAPAAKPAAEPLTSTTSGNAALQAGTTPDPASARVEPPAPPAASSAGKRPRQADSTLDADTGATTSRTPNVTSPLPKSKDLPPPPRSAMRPPRPSEPVVVAGTPYTLQDQGNGFTRLSTQLEARVVEVTEQAPAPAASLYPQLPRAGHEFQTPSPGRALASGNGNGYARESDDGYDSAKRVRYNRDYSPGPDTVYATPNLPPPRAISVSRSVIEDFADSGGLPPYSALARSIAASESARARRLARASSAATSTVGGSPAAPAHATVPAQRPLSPSPPPRLPSPPMTRQERDQKILYGKSIAEGAQLVYRQRIRDLGARYGIGVGEVMKAVDTVRGRKGRAVQMAWEEVTRGMDELFGYKE